MDLKDCLTAVAGNNVQGDIILRSGNVYYEVTVLQVVGNVVVCKGEQKEITFDIGGIVGITHPWADFVSEDGLERKYPYGSSNNQIGGNTSNTAEEQSETTTALRRLVERRRAMREQMLDGDKIS